MIPAGKRNHLVALQRITGRTASGDGYVDVWATYAQHYAAVVPARAFSAERFVSNTLQVPITHVVTLPYDIDVHTSHRVLHKTRPLYIRGIENEDEADHTLVLSCEERAQ